MYAVYILLCNDDSYYTGLTNDLDTRLWEHQTGFFPECYTAGRRPVNLVWHKIVETSDEAIKLEKQIKGWSRKKKEALIMEDFEELKRLAKNKQEPSTAPLPPFDKLRAQGLDYIIIGQGISGTFLSYYLQQEKKSFLVIDNNFKDSPSRIAAGIINPVTGRRMVTVWMADEVIPFAVNAYNQIGSQLGIQAISQRNIIDFFPNPFMRENFLKRVEENDQYIHNYSNPEKFESQFKFEFGAGEISPAYTAHIETLLPAWKKELEQNGQLINEEFEISELKVSDEKIRYKDIEAERIIFCDGSLGVNNTYFKQLPFAPNKGEALIVEIPGLSKDHIYKKSMTLAPLAQPNLFWIGSVYHWEFDNPDPTPAFKKNTEAVLKEWLKIPFKIVDHLAGIRPATIERRPFIGLHPNQPRIGIMNGMGTKGCSLAPYFAKQLVDHLLHDTPITPEADVRRFSKILSR